MSNADRVARDRAQAQQDALSERVRQQQREAATLRSGLIVEIDNLTEPALTAQKGADYPALETVEVRGVGERQRAGFRLADFWIEDRGSAIAGIDYLMGDGTFATSYENRALVLINDWEQVSLSRLEGIRDGIQRLSSPGA